MLSINKLVGMLGLVSVMSLSSAVSAQVPENCRDVYLPAIEKLKQVEAELITIKTKRIYEQSVNLRYNVIEGLLSRATACDVPADDAAGLREIHQVRMALSSLQASAQASAFTKFADWTSAMELDLNLCRKVLGAGEQKTAQ